MRITDGIDRLLRYLQVNGYSTSTHAIYRGQLKPFADWLTRQGITDLRAVTEVHLQAYRRRVYRQPLSRVTQDLRIRAVKRLFDHLIADQVLLLNPARSIAPAKTRQTLPRAIPSQAEMLRLLAAPNVETPVGLRDRAWLELAYSSGVRVGELPTWTWVIWIWLRGPHCCATPRPAMSAWCRSAGMPRIGCSAIWTNCVPSACWAPSSGPCS